MRAWLSDPPAPAPPALDQAPAVPAEPGPAVRLPELMRARSLSPRDGPRLGCRTHLIDGAADVQTFPTILLPYTLPAFQVGSALPLQLQDQPESAYMAVRSVMYASLLLFSCTVYSMLSCLHSGTICFLRICRQSSGTGASASSPAASRAHSMPLIRLCTNSFQAISRRLLFLLCIGCIIHNGTCTQIGSGLQVAAETEGQVPTPHTVPALPATGRLQPTAAESTRLPRKRALRRAIGRAARNPDHSTRYRGRLCTLDNLRGITTGPRERPVERSRPGVADTKHGPRLRAMSWNVGGLSQDAWLEVQIWLHEQEEHDIILLQETHWRFTSSWSLPHYHIFHSGATDHRFQGCMTVIRKSIATFDSVRWSAPLVGHLLHVRFPVKGRQVDVINLYQYALHTGPDRAAVLHKRERVLHHLDKTLSSLPIRNVLLAGGDFNSMGTRDSMPFGPGTYLGPNPHPDRQLLANLANTHRLTALNTWSRVSKAATFENDQARSQIDFFFARTAQIDGRSRCACTDPLFHLLRWRGGARHYPLRVSIPAIHYQSPTKVPDGHLARAPKYRLAQPPERVQAFCEHLTSVLSVPSEPSDLDYALQQAAAKHLLPVFLFSRGPIVTPLRRESLARLSKCGT